MTPNFQTVNWQDGKLIILDQTRLPLETVYEEITTIEQVWDAIYKLKVRGAPAIGVAAAYGLCLSVMDEKTKEPAEFLYKLKKNAEYLATSRPTAVNLFWALERIEKVAEAAGNLPVEDIKKRILEEAHSIKKEDQAICDGIGEHLLTLLRDGMGILTHCNAGAAATAGCGTALAPIYKARERGWNLKVFADETRPLLQGARLTAWELKEMGVDVTLICDNMAAMVMAQGKIDAVIVGCDRVAANGDFANKIGTYGVAILAKEHGIPFYVAAPSSTIDLKTQKGQDIVIEERKADEITCGFGRRTAPEHVKVFNPAFDVTPAKYVTAIVTEKGVIYPPFEEGIRKMFK
ncbi:MAG: S-methyl-5-thioribose-1-phosphate isomerase [Mahellales bacterium]|jgi:methylthioribose-1-phosphate isomerase